MNLPRVFIVGGGFGGVRVARRLAGLPLQVTLVDRRNYHLFQPLLYQVATATLSPAEISAPIRSLVREVANCRVVLAKVRGVDLKNKRLLFDRGAVPYDWLVLAAGATHSYFGREEWEKLAPGLKTIEDATEIRRRILLAFESAEFEGSAERRSASLTFAIVGGGPTGVELAGAIKEIAAKTIPRDFRHIDTTTTQVILLHRGDRLLPQHRTWKGMSVQLNYYLTARCAAVLLPELLEALENGAVAPRPQDAAAGEYYRWPDSSSVDKLRAQGHRVINARDLWGILSGRYDSFVPDEAVVWREQAG